MNGTTVERLGRSLDTFYGIVDVDNMVFVVVVVVAIVVGYVVADFVVVVNATLKI